MKILLFTDTPAQVHEFKNVIRALEARKHEVMLLARDYECTLSLLNAYGFKYQVYARASKASYGRALEFIPYVWKAYRLARKFNPDMVVGRCITQVYTAKLLRKPSIIFTDTETASLEHFLLKPFVTAIYTPACFRKDMGRKQTRYNGFKELAYLHPDYFQPDASIYDLLGISRDQRYVIIRLNPFDAFHDISIKGFSRHEDRLRLVQYLEPHARVFISSDTKLEPELQKYAINIPPHRMHDAEFYADMLIADTGTMLTEAAILGTPGIHCSSFAATKSLGNLVELEEKYQLIFNYSEPNQAIAKAEELIKQPELKQQWQEKKEKLLAAKINVLKFMVETIEGYAAKTK